MLSLCELQICGGLVTFDLDMSCYSGSLSLMVLIKLLSLSVSSAQEVLSKLPVVLETCRSAFVCLPVCLLALERCNPWPHVTNCHISVRDDVIHASRAYSACSPHSHYDVILIMSLRAYGSRSPRSHYDVILIMTSRAYGARSPRSHCDVIRY